MSYEFWCFEKRKQITDSNLKFKSKVTSADGWNWKKKKKRDWPLDCCSPGHLCHRFLSEYHYRLGHLIMFRDFLSQSHTTVTQTSNSSHKIKKEMGYLNCSIWLETFLKWLLKDLAVRIKLAEGDSLVWGGPY